MRVALARHDTLLRQAIEQEGGYVFKTVGDAFCAAFPTAPQAVSRCPPGPAHPQRRGLGRSRPSSCSHGYPHRDCRGTRQRLLSARLSTRWPTPLHRLRRAPGLLSLATQQLAREDLPPGTQQRTWARVASKTSCARSTSTSWWHPTCPPTSHPSSSTTRAILNPIVGAYRRDPTKGCAPSMKPMPLPSSDARNLPRAAQRVGERRTAPLPGGDWTFRLG